ncbi:hypothetical protein PPTG_09498 [Phytophthora nicotianae INRA-310]|uniref:RxLR effector protein n=1 Tax=Phytophthora nicotianae (strain INRA-310) TaxID=761204 RepID=W2QHT5_PHYN3|nr:hypothetical protein PPTG_09498 [Phytophthora nicotianae INRA-310]ETN11810.1 hypothetical protein PPTG_09498 [Phytophthora nicotianae INRA-310]
MKFGVFSALLLSAIAIASAQDHTTAGGQSGSVVADPNVPATTPPTTTGPQTAAPGGVNPAAPSPPAFAAPATQSPWDANPVPMTDSSGSGSFGSAGEIETPTRKPKKVTESPSTPTPTENSSASILATTGAWTAAGLALGLVAML